MTTRATIRPIAAFVVFCVLAFGTCTQVHAQLAAPVGGGTQIELEPNYPAPGKTFSARYANYSGSVSATDFRWTINGAHDISLDDQSAVTLTAPALGVPMRIEVSAKTQAGGVVRSVTTVVPAAADFIFEGETSAPYFYMGRRVPAIGGNVHIVAMPQVYDRSGALIPLNELRFRWSIDDAVVAEGMGKQSVSVAIPAIGGATLALSIDSTDGTAHYRTFTTVPTADPTLQFYVDNPRTGLSRNALSSVYTTSENEVAVRAEPYFISSSAFGNSQITWTLNSNPTANGSDPQMLSLRKVGDGGSSEVGFSLYNLSALSQYVQGIFMIEFK